MAEPAAPVPARIRCEGCGAELASTLLVCASCHRLIHAGKLKALAEEAEQKERAGELSLALVAWRAALELLPASTQQHQAVLARAEAVSRKVEATGGVAGPAGGEHKRGVPKALAGLGAVGLLVWKFKFLLAFVLTKGKFLLLGLTKASTVFSMLLAVGAYWALWGWRFAALLVLCIYVHEMGHVYALRRLGIAASAPMFIPGFGALVRLRQNPLDGREDARIGLAGPLWGLGATGVVWLGSVLLDAPLLAAVARVNAWINVFNLVPVWTLDGSRGFRALSQRQRGLVLVGCGAAWFLSAETMFLLVLLAGAVRLLLGAREAPAQGDRRTLVEFAVLLAANAYLVTVGAAAVPAP